jgi:hypothetical protein
MTAKERLQALVEELSEPAAERALKLVEKESEDPEPADSEDETAKPGDIIDDWGNIDAWSASASKDTMRMLDEEDAAIGFSWEQRDPA